MNGIREAMNRNPKIAVAVFGGIVGFIVLYWLVSFLFFSPSSGVMPSPTKAYFSIDDGKTTFTDKNTLIPPFTKDGKPAVRAFLYSCDSGKTEMVAFLFRFDAKTQGKISPETDAESLATSPLSFDGIEVKRPTDKDWTPKKNIKEYSQIVTVKCPDGTPATEIIP